MWLTWIDEIRIATSGTSTLTSFPESYTFETFNASLSIFQNEKLNHDGVRSREEERDSWKKLARNEGAQSLYL